MLLRTLWVSFLVAASTLSREASAHEPTTCSAVDRVNLVACALQSSLALESERWGGVAARARLSAASPLLPSNPVVSLSAARRSQEATNQTATNWTADLSQEFELGGQRGARRAAAAAEVNTFEQRRILAAREVAVRAWVSYFDALAARETARLAIRLETAMAALEAAAQGRAERGLVPPVDADLAEVALAKATVERVEAERQLHAAEAVLAASIGYPSGDAVRVEGQLVPIDGVDRLGAGDPQPAPRPELLSLQAEQRFFDARARVFRRARVPNVTLQVFVQRDGFAEQVLGAGIAFPLPLPSPVGRTYSGEIAEADALSHRAAAEQSRVRRVLRTRLAVARSDYDARRTELEVFKPERLLRTVQTLTDIESELAAGRLAVRDAVLIERSLIDFLQADIEARKGLCLASVELARAAGFAFEGGAK